MIYDTAARNVHTVFPFNCEFTTWSHDGRYITGTSNYPVVQQSIALYDVTTDQWTFASFADSVVDVISIGTWLPGDTALNVGIILNNAVRSYSYAMGVTSPYRLSKLPDPYYDAYTGTAGIAVEGDNRNVRLRIGQIGNVDSMRTYSLSAGIIEAAGFSRVSSDGNWLAFRMDADIGGSRFGFAGKVTSLGIIDLRPGSSTQYQLYRVFPDYTNTYRNCSSAWFFSGVAWSGDGKYVYHEQVRIADSTTQIVRRDVRTGKVEPVSNFLTPP